LVNFGGDPIAIKIQDSLIKIRIRIQIRNLLKILYLLLQLSQTVKSKTKEFLIKLQCICSVNDLVNRVFFAGLHSSTELWYLAVAMPVWN